MVEQIALESYSRLLAIVASKTACLAVAEDALSEAFQTAVRQWPAAGVPRAPEAWLLTVARRRLIDELRRTRFEADRESLSPRAAEAVTLQAIDEVAQLEEAGERLKLLLVCTHPALDPAIRTPLMLQVVLGIDAARIASAFLVARAAMSQRLVRAKSKIREARIPFTIPAIEDLPDRLEAVFEAVYAAFSLVWDAAPGSDHAQRGLVNEAIALARLLVRLLPKEPEAMGLLALMLHCEARREARRNIHGHYVPLADQDRALWSLPMIAEAESLLRLTATSNAPGRFQ